MSLKFYLSAIASIALIVLMPHSGESKIDPMRQSAIMTDLQELRKHSDIVVQGQVEYRNVGISLTEIKFHINEVLHGEYEEPYVKVISETGKVYMNQEEPQFTRAEKAILFLYKDGNAYRCVNGAHGKKVIRHQNIYVNPEDTFKNMKLQDYLNGFKIAGEENLKHE